MTAATPDGKTIPLVKIPKWDFRWQYFYTFPKMVKIPKGSTIAVIGVYDNTTNNPNNPFSPPREVIGTNGSMRMTDEMFHRAVRFLSNIGSPASMIFSDDVEMLERCQQGLARDAVSWIDFSRGMDSDERGADGSVSGAASEMPMRMQFQAWVDYMTAEAA